MIIKLKNITAGVAEVHVQTARGERHAGWVQRADEGRKWIALNHHTVSWANPPQQPQFLTRNGAAWALVDGEVIR